MVRLELTSMNLEFIILPIKLHFTLGYRGEGGGLYGCEVGRVRGWEGGPMTGGVIGYKIEWDT